MKKLICVILIFFISFFFFGLDDVSAKTLNCSPTIRRYGNDDKYIEYTLTYLETGSDNTSVDKIKEHDPGATNPAGIFFDSSMKNSLAKQQAKLNEDGSGTLVFYASAVTNHYPIGLDIGIEVNGKKITNGNEVTGCSGLDSSDGHIKFSMKMTSKGYTKDDKIVFNLVAPVGLNDSGAAACGADKAFLVGIFVNPDYCDSRTEFAIDVPIETSALAAEAGGDADAQEGAVSGVEVNSTTTSHMVNIKTWGTTDTGTVVIGTSQGINCDSSLRSFISKYWKYFMILTPVLLIIMITIDFAKAVFSSDQELIKKASSNAIKRVIAGILLLCLPLILELILSFFGIELCI